MIIADMLYDRPGDGHGKKGRRDDAAGPLIIEIERVLGSPMAAA